MSHVLRHLFVPSLAATALLAFSARTWAGPDQSITFPVDVDVLCGADTLHLTGDAHLVVNISSDSAGGHHISLHFNYQEVSGTNQDGVVFHVSHVDSLQMNIPAGGSLETDVHEEFRLVGQGSAPNFLLRETAHITFDANGNLTSFHDHAGESDCGDV